MRQTRSLVIGTGSELALIKYSLRLLVPALEPALEPALANYHVQIVNQCNLYAIPGPVIFMQQNSRICDFYATKAFRVSRVVNRCSGIAGGFRAFKKIK